MAYNTSFGSRTGKVTCSDKDVFTFASDIRNFGQFVPEGTVTNFAAEKDSCSFSVSMIGTVSVRIASKTEFSSVIFEGDALNKEDFRLSLEISGESAQSACVKVTVDADLNPMLKIVASRPLERFLEILIEKMESFRGWKEIRE
ncbi:MAG: hypothetical protein MUE32_00990 [Bacteroidales bacterium]|jgi:carbon monoxide dehydrogenase subunit G|nr:hypothetical protein [Bacteroidales bacterium]